MRRRRCSPADRGGRARPRPARRPSPARPPRSDRARSPWRRRSPSAIASRLSCRRATRINLAPGSRAIRLAVASPMPLEAPVTSAITPGTLPQAAGKFRCLGRLAQLGERRLDKAEVTGSSPVVPMAMRCAMRQISPSAPHQRRARARPRRCRPREGARRQRRSRTMSQSSWEAWQRRWRGAQRPDLRGRRLRPQGA